MEARLPLGYVVSATEWSQTEEIVMKKDTKRMLGVLGIVAGGVLTIMGCGQRNETETTEPPGAVERTRDAAGRGIERSGEALEKAGDAMQETGEDMQQ
jgi:hypothetical protein